MLEQLALLPGLLTAHLQLSLIALLLGACISIPLGIAVMQTPRLRTLVLSIASIIQTIPSLALLAIMVPVLATVGRFTDRLWGFSISSIGYPPALVALCLYSILPMLRNTVTGLAGVDPALVEAALGVGMTPRQRLWRVELPLALPTIIAGMRTATIWVVGMTVLSTPVGAPSLGNYIFTGLQTRNFNAVVVGCVSAAVLALGLDVLVRSCEVGLLGPSRRRLWGALVCLVALYGYVVVSLAASHVTGKRELRVGAKDFTEQYILAEIVALTLHDATGSPVRIMSSLGSNVAFDALKDGAIDAYVDYSGTVWSTLMKRDTRHIDHASMLQESKAFLKHEGGAETVAILGFENTYTLAMRRKEAAARRVVTIGDLARQSQQLRVAGDYEFFGRGEWRALQETYGIRFREQRVMDPALMYEAIADGSVDVLTAYTTDGRLDALDLRILEDTEHVLPPYDAMLLAGEHLTKNTHAIEALRALEGTITLKAMQRMDYAVDHDHQSPAAVARDFLAGKYR